MAAAAGGASWTLLWAGLCRAHAMLTAGLPWLGSSCSTAGRSLLLACTLEAQAARKCYWQAGTTAVDFSRTSFAAASCWSAWLCLFSMATIWLTELPGEAAVPGFSLHILVDVAYWAVSTCGVSHRSSFGCVQLPCILSVRCWQVVSATQAVLDVAVFPVHSVQYIAQPRQCPRQLKQFESSKHNNVTIRGCLTYVAVAKIRAPGR